MVDSGFIHLLFDSAVCDEILLKLFYIHSKQLVRLMNQGDSNIADRFIAAHFYRFAVIVGVIVERADSSCLDSLLRIDLPKGEVSYPQVVLIVKQQFL